MAYYTYKAVCNDIPEHIRKRFIDENGREPDDDPNYNGDCWTLTKMWIEELQDENSQLREEVFHLRQ